MIKYILFLSVLTSCNEMNNEHEMRVQNKTNSVIDSISIYINGVPPSNRKFYRLKPKESMNFTLDMSKMGGDGSYRIDFKRTNSKRTESKCFGYFTNGSPMEELIIVSIEDSTVNFDYK